MVEPFSMGVLGALAATEGIKFLYGQAAEVLRRWRDRKAGKEAEATAPIVVPEAEAAAVLAGTLRAPTVDFEAMERLHEDIRVLAGALGSYANGIDEPDPEDGDLMAAADGLRRALEAVYGQRITFKGEQREAPGAAVVGRAGADEVAGALVGVRARLVRAGRIEGTATAGKVTESGRVVGADVDTVG